VATQTTQATVSLFQSDGFVIVPLAEDGRRNVLDTISAGHDFFREPDQSKLHCCLPEECGYRPMGIEYSQSPDRPDQIESFTVSRRIGNNGSVLKLAAARVLFDRMLATFDLIENIAEALTIGLSDSISGHLNRQVLQGAFHSWSRLQLNYSRPAEAGERLIHDAHEDGDLITLACATSPGLELRMDNGKFRPISIPPGQLIAMPGEIAWLLSGGEIQPLWHRVRPLPNCVERIALLFFADIDPSCCQPWVRNAINENVDIGARLRASVKRFGLKGFASP
jgi:isopenicillin N synthase-like dioxygenase